MIGLLRVWRDLRDQDALRRSIAKARRRPKAGPSRAARKRHQVRSDIFEGREVISVTPVRARPGAILFLHGGCYTFEALAQHWSFVDRLAETCKMKIVVPAYPLAPESDVSDALAFVLALYSELYAENGDIIVVGDSAGGGLALASSQQAAVRNMPRCNGLVLISPWLDGVLDDPEQAAIEPRDPALRRAGLRAAARLYAGTVPIDDPRVSPLNGNLSNLPPVLVFAGSRDILVTDARRLKTRADLHGTRVDYHEAEGLFHDWPLLPLPESKRALRTIQRFIGEVLPGSDLDDHNLSTSTSPPHDPQGGFYADQYR